MRGPVLCGVGSKCWPRPGTVVTVHHSQLSSGLTWDWSPAVSGADNINSSI